MNTYTDIRYDGEFNSVVVRINSNGKIHIFQLDDTLTFMKEAWTNVQIFQTEGSLRFEGKNRAGEVQTVTVRNILQAVPQ